jgi:hypothetical protein
VAATATQRHLAIRNVAAPVNCNPSLEEICLGKLLDAQNPDGGWGFRSGRMSAIEPTSLALLAQVGIGLPLAAKESAGRACEFLLESQLRDGSWPALPREVEGSWTTSLACLALWPFGGARDEVLDGARWLCEHFLGERRSRFRIGEILFAGSGATRQDPSRYGWPWTEGTVNWVEPIATATLALARIPAPLLPSSAAKCRRLSVAKLVDRMCPGGGWNRGEPVVNGAVPGPEVGPTVWALLALRNTNAHDAVEKSLNWLTENGTESGNSAALASAHICLGMYGCGEAAIEREMRRQCAAGSSCKSVCGLAWSVFALRADERAVTRVFPAAGPLTD